MIEVRGLTKTYGSERAVDDISFEVKKGEVLGFLGPNGAGKSTTMKVITCYLNPTMGTVLVDNMDVRKESLAVRKRIGYLPENTPLYQDMTTSEYLTFVASLRGIPSADRSKRMAHMASVCGIGNVMGKRIEELSKGYRQRVGLAQAMIHDPEIVILDEPTSGLDPNQIVEIRELIKGIGLEKTVILSTHILSEVQASCDRVLIINRGTLVADGTPDDLKADFSGAQQIKLGLLNPPEDVVEVLNSIETLQISGQEQIADNEVLFSLTIDAREDFRAPLYNMAVDNAWTLTELHKDQVNLEDVFRQLTTN